MKYTDKVTVTVERSGIIDTDDNGAYIMTIQGKDEIKTYDVVKDILPIMVGKFVMIKSEDITEG